MHPQFPPGTFRYEPEYYPLSGTAPLPAKALAFLLDIVGTGGISNLASAVLSITDRKRLPLTEMPNQKKRPTQPAKNVPKMSLRDQLIRIARASRASREKTTKMPRKIARAKRTIPRSELELSRPGNRSGVSLNNVPFAVSTTLPKATLRSSTIPGGERVIGIDIVCPLTIPNLAAAFTQVVSMPVNAGNSLLFRNLGQRATNYETYHFRKLLFRVVPFTKLTSQAVVAMYPDYDSKDAAPNNIQDCMNNSDATAGMDYANLVCAVHSGRSPMRKHFVSNVTTHTDDADARLQNIADIYVYVDHWADDMKGATIGYLVAEYECDFQTIRPPASVAMKMKFNYDGSTGHKFWNFTENIGFKTVSGSLAGYTVGSAYTETQALTYQVTPLAAPFIYIPANRTGSLNLYPVTAITASIHIGTVNMATNLVDVDNTYTWAGAATPYSMQLLASTYPRVLFLWVVSATATPQWIFQLNTADTSEISNIAPVGDMVSYSYPEFKDAVLAALEDFEGVVTLSVQSTKRTESLEDRIKRIEQALHDSINPYQLDEPEVVEISPQPIQRLRHALSIVTAHESKKGI